MRFWWPTKLWRISQWHTSMNHLIGTYKKKGTISQEHTKIKALSHNNAYNMMTYNSIKSHNDIDQCRCRASHDKMHILTDRQTGTEIDERRRECLCEGWLLSHLTCYVSVIYRYSRPWVEHLDWNTARLAPNGTNLGLLKISFLVILARCAKMNRKLILKSPRFVWFHANLAQLEDKSEICLMDELSLVISTIAFLSPVPDARALLHHITWEVRVGP